MTRAMVHPVLLLALFATTHAKKVDRYHELSLQGIEHAYNMEIDTATAIFDEIIRMDPDNPHGYILQSVNYFYRFQFEEAGEVYVKQFKRYTAEAIKRSKKRLSNKEKALDALFYLGTAHMYLAAYHSSKSNWIRAYWYGKHGIEYLEKVVAIDPDYYDAYLGLGLYHYYADVMPKFIKTVSSFLGISGDRKRGLQDLQLAAEKGTYSRAEALFFLGNIYLYTENESEQALACAQKLASLYPKGFLLFHGETLQKNGRHQEALEVFNRAIAENDSARFPFFTIWSHYLLGNVYFELNQFKRAIEQHNLAIEMASKSTDRIKFVFAWSNFRIAESYEMLGQHQVAVSFYNKVKKGHHKRAYKRARERLKKPLLKAELDLTLGHNHYKRKNFDQAIEIYRTVLSKAMQDTKDYPARKVPRIYHHIGKALFKKEDFQAAVSTLGEVVAMEDVREKWIKPWSHYYLGKCYIEMDDIQKALEQFATANKLDDNRLRFEIEKAREALDLKSVKK